MNRVFFINVIFLITINLLIKPLYIFGIDRVVQNTVGEASYGLYFAILNFTFLLQIINDFGLQNFNNKNISQHQNLLGKYFPNIIILKIVLSGLYLTVLFPVAYFLLRYEVSIFPLILAIGINQILISLMFYMRSNVSGLGMYRTDSILSAMDKTLMILICGAMLYIPALKADFKIEWFIYAQTSTLLATVVVSYLIVRKHLPPIRWRINTVYWWVILRQSYPYALVIFLMTIYTKIDGVMIERMLPDGATEVGIYASGYRLLDAVNMTGFLFSGLLLPMFARILKSKESVIPLLKISFLLIWTISIAVSVNTWFFQEEIMLLLYNNADAYWGVILGFLILTFIPVSGIYILGTLLMAKGEMTRMNQVYVIGIIVNVVMNYFLIQSHQAAGAAVATLVTQSVILLSHLILVKHFFALPVNWIEIGRIAGFSLMVVFTAFLFYHYLEWDWRIKYVLSGSIAALLALILGMINPQMIKKLK